MSDFTCPSEIRCFYPNHNVQHLVPGMITSFYSNYMTFGDHHGKLITSWRERACRLYALGYRSKYTGTI